MYIYIYIYIYTVHTPYELCYPCVGVRERCARGCVDRTRPDYRLCYVMSYLAVSHSVGLHRIAREYACARLDSLLRLI